MTADTTQTGGTYTLLVELFDTATIEVGALGMHTFEPGWYAYVGSANGTGGFARVDRHREVAAGTRDVRHWHIDYLLGHPETEIDTVVQTTGVDGECPVATAIDGVRIPEFGCSDCGCDSHLVYGTQRAPLVASIEAAHQQRQS